MLALVSGPDYRLTSQTQLLLSEPDPTVTSKLSYSATKHEYVINKDGTKPPASANPTVLVGQPSTGLYTATLPDNLARGITVTNDTAPVSFTLEPQFRTSPVKAEHGHFVYPGQNGIQAVYTPQADQLAEDLVLNHPIGNRLTLSYDLRLPSGLKATPGADGTVLVSRHGLPLFALAAPMIRESNGKSRGKPAPATARLFLHGSSLTLVASGLSKLIYPLVIDPSILINSSNGFLTGNNEGDVTATSNQFAESGLSGGELSAWSATASLLTGDQYATSVTYNGYVYEVGGYNSGVIANVEYAPINPNGTLGSWTATTSLPTATDSASSVVYNGYIYEIGGYTSSYTATVDYAPINPNGTLGSWTATTSLPTAAEAGTSVVYNGYIYEIGGYNGSPISAVEYASINSNGTLGSWTTAGSGLLTAAAEATSIVYNGFIYEIGGYNSGGLTAVEFAPISSSGATGTWTSTTSLPTVTYQSTSVVYNGYLYEIGGNQGSGCISSVLYAAINANGTLGSWTQSEASLPVGTCTASSIAYNGYLYEIGNNGSTTTVDYSQIQPAGYTSSYTATTSLPTATDLATSVVYNSYLYEIGGYTSAATATVDYAAINSNGTLGSWTATTSLLAATYRASSSAYNGYVYEIGGLNSGGNPVTTVDYAPVNSNGTLGSWTATTSLPTATACQSSVAYNGYLYVLGGYLGATCGPSVTATVDYAPINSNGTLGSWTATTSLPTGVGSATSVTYGGYIYEIGGYTTATVDYALINSNGTLGSWTATTSLPTATSSATSVIYNGYVYEVGGYTSAATATVDYAPINSNGTLGSWTATTSLPAATYDATSVIYNGYVYEVGGYTSAATATVDYAAVNNGGPGTVQSWNSTTSLPAATDSATSVAYNGYVYEIGGYNGTSEVATVDYAPINSNGTLGSWTATTSLPTATDGASSVVYNGYVYEIGGYNGSAAVSTVDYAPINSNGTVGSWTATTSLPVATDGSAWAVYNGYAYEVDGTTTSGATASVYYAPINSNGTLGNWTATTNLAIVGGLGVDYGSALAYNGYLYEFGGYSTNYGICASTVYYAPLNSNGTLGNWAATTNLPVAISNQSFVAYDGYAYELGVSCNSASYQASVYYAPINSNGTLGSWTATTSLPAATDEASSVVYNGYVYEIGGQTSSFVATANVYSAALNSIPRVGQYSMLVNLAPAYNLTWNSTTSLPAATDAATSVSYNGYIYEIGGSTGSVTTNVDYSSTNVNGPINAWNSTTSLPAATDSATSVAYNGYVYEIGGYNGTSEVATVDYAPINSNGTLGSWTATTSLPAATDGASSVVYNGYVYEIGGYNGSAAVSTVDYAPINSNGTVGSWTATTSLPVALQNQSSAAVVYNSYLYQVGGCGSSSFDASCNLTTVDYVPLNSNGTLGSWTATTALPFGMTAPVVTYGGYIYTVGGFSSSGSCDGNILYAPINSDGSLGSWVNTTAIGTNCGAGAIVYDGVAYVVGGDNNGPLSNVVYASLINPDVTPDAIVVNGTNTGNPGIGGLANSTYSGLGGITVQYENGTAQCTTLSAPTPVDFGAQELGEAYKLDFTSDGCGTSTGLSEYLWLHFTLDDSQTATFPDVNSNHTTITAFQIFFHPATQTRLRGGMTLQNGVTQSLDAPPSTSQ